MKKLLLLFLLPLAAFSQNTDPGYGQFRNVALTSTASQVKLGSTNLMGYTLINVNTTPVYVKFFNASGASTVVGTTVPKTVIMVPPGDGTSPGVVYLSAENVSALFFPIAMSAACVTGLADNSAAAPATPIYVEVLYK